MTANNPKYIKTSQEKLNGLNQMKRFEQSSNVSKQGKPHWAARIGSYLFLPSDNRSNVMGQYRTDAVDRIGTSLIKNKESHKQKNHR